jgi:O-antigen ligase/tetratricopeptide (TPR) repeat protein
MVNQQEKPVNSKALKILDSILFVICLGIIVVRVRISEMPLAQSSDNFLYHSSAPDSLIISAILISAFLLWLTFRILTGQLIYRKSLIEFGLLILIIASFISGYAASNGRAAVTNAVVFIAPVFMAVLLIQLLDTDLKIKIVIAVIASAGFLNAFFQSADQFLKSNQEVIALYKKNPLQILNQYGIEPNSIDQFQFEHRLYSNNVVGYFTTSNTAGSFFILAFFAAALLLIEKIRNRKLPDADNRYIFSCGIVVLVILAGLFFTRSKGAIAAFLLAVLLFAIFWFFGKYLYAHRKKIFIAVCLLAALAAIAVFSFSLSNKPLFGGNSMLIRQQYWQAALNAYQNKPLTGIGPGNFADTYFQYKLPQSLETISDPHNFIISILLQYGPLGLIGFLLILFIPLSRLILTQSVQVPFPDENQQTKFHKIIIGVFLFVLLLIIKPPVQQLFMQSSPEEQIAAFIYLYLIPAFAFLLGFMFITAGPQSMLLNRQSIYPFVSVIAISCALAGFLIHNFVDIALFEPSILTAFFALLACLIAADLNCRRRAVFCNPPLIVKLLIPAASIIIVWALLSYAVSPVYKSVKQMASAKQFADIGRFEWAYPLLEKAANDDPLSPLPPSMNGRFYLINFTQQRQDTVLLIKAQDCFSQAIERNKEGYKDYENLSNVFLLLSQSTEDKLQKTEWLNKSFTAAQHSVSLYPTSDRLRFYLAQVSELLGKKDVALENYKKAVLYEDDFREQFEKLYPKSPFFSRLGVDNYNNAKQRIEQLSK